MVAESSLKPHFFYILLALAVVLVLPATAPVANGLPARRAARIDPMRSPRRRLVHRGACHVRTQAKAAKTAKKPNILCDPSLSVRVRP